MTSRRRCVPSTGRPYSSGRWRNGLTTTTSPKRCPAWKSSLSKHRQPGAQLPESVYIELVQDLPTYRSEALIPQALQPFPRPRLLAGVGRVYGVEEDIRVYKKPTVAGHEPLHGSGVRQHPEGDCESSSLARMLASTRRSGASGPPACGQRAGKPRCSPPPLSSGPRVRPPLSQ